MQLADDVHSPAFQLLFLRMAKVWPVLVQTRDVPRPIAPAKRVPLSKHANPSLRIREARTPMALLRRLKKLRQENASLRRRFLMQTD